MALLFFAGAILLARSFELNGIKPELAEKYIIAAALSGLIGARLWFMFFYYDPSYGSIWEALFSSAGFTFYGGFIFAAITLILLAKRDNIPIYKLADSVGPALALGYAIGRLGCQLSGDGDYGIATSGILGMSYSQGAAPTPAGVEVYPTPLYESIMSLMILWVLLKVESAANWQLPWKRFGLYLSLIAAERFLIEFIRAEPRYSFGLSEAQYIAVILFFIGLFLLYKPRPQTG